MTDASTLEVDWNNVTGKPADVTNGDSDTLDALNCSDGEIAIKQVEFGHVLDFRPFWMLMAMDHCNGVTVMMEMLLLETPPMMLTVMVLLQHKIVMIPMRQNKTPTLEMPIVMVLLHLPIVMTVMKT